MRENYFPRAQGRKNDEEMREKRMHEGARNKEKKGERRRRRDFRAT